MISGAGRSIAAGVSSPRRHPGAQASGAAQRADTGAAESATSPGLATTAGRVSLVLCGTALALAPLPFGSVTTGAVALWCCLLAFGVATAPLSHLHRRHWIVLAPVLATAGVFGAVVTLQWLGSTATLRDPIWDVAGAALQEPMRASLSVSPGLAYRSLGLGLLVLLAFVNAFLLATDRARARQLILVAAYSGLAYALYGIMAHALAPTSLLWTEKHYYLTSLTGTFVNRNTAATFFGSCGILWLVLVLTELDRRLPDPGASLGEAFAALTRTSPVALLLRLCAFLVCLAATLLTTSRAGSFMTALGILLVLVVYAAPRLRGRIGGWRGFAVAAVGFLLLVELWSGGVAMRLSQTLFRLDQRWESYGATLALIGDHFWLGAGLGTYAAVFPAYRPADFMTGIIWDIAHSTPLELAAELGVPFVLLVVLLGLFLFVRLVRGALSSSGGAAYCAAAAGVAFLGAAHSAVDFSVQIPGYAVVFTMIVACGLAQSVPRRRSRNGATT